MNKSDSIPYGDPFNRPYWEAASAKKLAMQQCRDCLSFQFYGRPFCLQCDSDNMHWKAVSGKGRIYSMTRVHMSFDPERKPPYIVALVDLDEGTRVLTNLVEHDLSIGDRVRVHWQDRDSAPPLALFERDAEPDSEVTE